MIHLDLFSGIGGFALATDRAFGKVEHIFCEIDPFCQLILKKHWPQSKIYGDIRTISEESLATDARGYESRRLSGQSRQESTETGIVHILTGGFPCQPFSQAGRRKGTEDDNGNGDALPCRDGNDIIGACNGDTTTSVRDARNARGERKEAVIANLVQPNIKQNGGQKTSNEDGQTTGHGARSENTRFTDDMEGNVPVAERTTLPSSQSTTRTAGETRSDGSTTAKRGNSSSKTDTQRPTKSSASTATTPSTTSEPALINGERVFLLTGGFPCQPFSQAGKRKGTEDERHLWPEMLRIIKIFQPEWIIAENVRGILTIGGGMVFEQVCIDLEESGYEVQPIVIPAVALNAPHRRDRVWFIAHSQSTGTRSESGKVTDEGRRTSKNRGEGIRQTYRKIGTSRSSSADRNAPDTEGERSGRGNNKESGTDKRKLVKEKQKRDSTRNQGEGRHRKSYAHSGSTRLERRGQEGEGCGGQLNRKRSYERPDWGENWLEVATRLCRMDDGISRGLDGITENISIKKCEEISGRWHVGSPYDICTTKENVREIKKEIRDSNKSNRNPRLKSLGNAIVPAVAEEIMRAIKLSTPVN